ncbi:MAG: iron hydrogenase small subunit [Clostridia bacterium]|nr:iron hydrogenase small subunit [Clostridia bacterium]
MKGLYKIDQASQIKLSSENPYITMLYSGLLKDKQHKLLHNHIQKK